jgi:hypothetical protein
MNNYAIVKHLESSKDFALLLEERNGVVTIGISPQGKEWERWADSLPAARRKSIDALLSTFGSNLSIEGPKKITRAIRAQFDELVQKEQAEEIDAALATSQSIE